MKSPPSHIEQEISALREKIEATRCLLKEQEERLATLLLWNTKTPFSQAWPPEIIDEVIEHLLSDYSGGFEQQAIQRGQIRLVCRTWDHLVLSKPALWTRFFFQLGPHCRRSLRARLQACELQLPRSLDQGLQFFAEGTKIGSKDKSILNSFASLMRNSSTRWTSITLSGWALYPLLQRLFSKSYKGNTVYRWSSLHTLSMSGCGPGDEDRIDLPPERFPALRALHFTDIALELFVWKLPWAQLKSLHFKTDTTHLSIHLEVLGQCVNLEDLEFTSVEGSLAPHATRPEIELPSLLSFKLIAYDAHQSLFEQVLPRLILPRLQSLEICDGWTSTEDQSRAFVEALCQIVEQSRCNLQSLRFFTDGEWIQAPIHEPSLAALLHKTQTTLRKLVIRSIGVTGRFLRGFDPDNLEEFVMLEELTLGAPEAETELAWWLDQQTKREGGKERCQRMKTTFYRQNRNALASERWKLLEMEGYPFEIQG